MRQMGKIMKDNNIIRKSCMESQLPPAEDSIHLGSVAGLSREGWRVQARWVLL